jgi:serine/threonine protein kinase
MKTFDKINPESKEELLESYKQIFSEVSINLSIPNPMVNLVFGFSFDDELGYLVSLHKYCK